MYVKQGEAVSNLDGLRILAPFLSQRLLGVLRDASACQRDWHRQQPKGSTDKPPFVDCCLFASSPEGVPAAFELGPTEPLPDHRYKICIDFTYKDRPGTYADPKIPLQTLRWRDAAIVALEAGRYKIDDFLFLRDSPQSPALPLSKSFDGCRGRRWIEQQQGSAAP
jgi:hypothetical protein